VFFFSCVIKRVYFQSLTFFTSQWFTLPSNYYSCRTSGHCVGKFNSRKILCFAVINLASLGKYPSLNFHLLLRILYTPKAYTEMSDRTSTNKSSKQRFDMQNPTSVRVVPNKFLKLSRKLATINK